MAPSWGGHTRLRRRLDRARYIALCPEAAPACPGLSPQDTRNPACDRGAGDDSGNPAGSGCNAADVCAPGWHVCLDANEVANASTMGCVGATRPGDPALQFLSRQSSNGCGVCATGTRTDSDCNSQSCTAGCLQTERLSNDVFGCGNYGATTGGSCSPLDRFSGNMCGCSCAQIIAALDLGEGHVEHGCSISAMRDWTALVASR